MSKAKKKAKPRPRMTTMYRTTMDRDCLIECAGCGKTWGDHFGTRCPGHGSKVFKMIRRKIAGSMWRNKKTGEVFRVERNKDHWRCRYSLQKGHTYYAPITYYRLIKHMVEV